VASERSACSATSSAGASSSTTWALVPLIPNDDTAARRGCPGSAQGRFSRETRSDPADQSTLDVGSAACRVAGSTRWRSAPIALTTPATPAAPCVCPRLDFTEPNHTGSALVP
jgi:hypothetical protein